jgi:hypothetical protein
MLTWIPSTHGYTWSTPDRSRPAKARRSACQAWANRVITGAGGPAEEPRNRPSAGPKSPLESPCGYGSGNTRVIFGVLRHRGGGIAGENRAPRAGVGVDAAVVDPRGEQPPRPMRSVAHHRPPPVLVALTGEPGGGGVDLGLHASASIRRAPSRTISSITDEPPCRRGSSASAAPGTTVSTGRSFPTGVAAPTFARGPSG